MSGRSRSATSSDALDLIEKVRVTRPLRFRDERITMAHGAGGKATHDADRGPARAALGLRRWTSSPTPAPLDVEARAGADHRQLRRPAAALPRRLDRRAGRQRHRQRPRRGRRPPAGPDAVARSSRRAWPPTMLRARGGGDRGGRARRPAWRSSPATRRWSSAATATACTSTTTGVGRRDPRARRSRPPRSCPATGSSSPARSASTASRSCSRAASSSLDADVESDTRSLWPAVDALLDAAGPSLRCMRDATRGGVATVLNELARASGVGDPRARGGRAGRTPPSPAPARSSGSTRCTSPTRASSSPSSHPRWPTPRSRRCAPCPAARRGRDRRGRAPSRPGMVLVETGFGGRRVMDHARRRPAAEDLLRRGRCTSSRIADAIVRRRRRHAAGRRVVRVEVRVGHLRQVVPERAEFAFALVAEGTAVDGAELEIEHVPAPGRVPRCGGESRGRGRSRCAAPAAADWTWTSSPARSCSSSRSSSRRKSS